MSDHSIGGGGDVTAIERQAHAEAKDLGAGIEHAAASDTRPAKWTGVDVPQRGLAVSVAQLPDPQLRRA